MNLAVYKTLETKPFVALKVKIDSYLYDTCNRGSTRDYRCIIVKQVTLITIIEVILSFWLFRSVALVSVTDNYNRLHNIQTYYFSFCV